MAETKEKPKAETANGVATKTSTGIVVGGKTLTREEAAKLLQEMTTGEKDSGYLEFEPGEEKRVVFLGWEKINGMGAQVGTMVPAVKFLTDSGKEQINADTAVVSYFEKQTEGITRLVRCTGLAVSKTSGFEYKKFDFFELNPKK